MPTTTSERWLRQAAPRNGKFTAVTLPEEDAVIEALSTRLRLTHAGQPHAHLERLDRELQGLLTAAGNTSHDEELAYRDAAASLLALWPVIDDPWHPAFAETLSAHGGAIAHHLEQSDSYAAYQRAARLTDHAQQAVWDKRVESAPVERLVRALDNRAMAGRLRAKGGPSWDTYQALLTCERATL
ncbi:MAG: hypothetical protein JKY37_00830 [Nannocystaceae bacterium]|nr:hypothetical protein [Nannocystaceae bacterium]